MNQLTRIAEFRKILADYRLSDADKKLLRDVRLLLFVAPTATGRNVIIRELEKLGNYHFIVSDTTRQPRINNGVPEQNGREYWFRTEDEMLDELKHDELIEAAVIHNQQVSGISKRELVTAQEVGKTAVKDVDVIGAATIHKLKPDAVVLFMVPPTFDIWMERLHSRGYMSSQEIERRIESAERELATALEADYYRFILNDTLEGTSAEINRLVMDGEYDPFKERFARERTEALYKEVESYLGSRAHHELRAVRQSDI
jgi:guanylate kinase